MITLAPKALESDVPFQGALFRTSQGHQGEGEARLAGTSYQPGAESQPMRTNQARMQVAACTAGHAGLGRTCQHAPFISVVSAAGAHNASRRVQGNRGPYQAPPVDQTRQPGH